MTVGCSKEKWTLTVGPYNDFLSNGGELEVSSAALDAHDGVEHMRQVLAALGAARIPVFSDPHLDK